MNTDWQILPKEFLEELEKIVPSEKREEVFESFTFPKPSTFRANTLKISTEELKKLLNEKNIPFEEVSFLQNAFVLKGIPQKEFTSTDIYSQGLIYVQSLSSMIPPLILDPKPDETVLDLTAAPGSKTTQMAALMNNSGKITANDKSRVRLYRLEANLKVQGVTNTEITYLDGKDLWKKYPEFFDKTLVDVPCSMEGRFYTGYEKSYRDWTMKKVKELSQIQKFILRGAVSATKVGGTIVYSTCTLSPEENEEVIDWIIKKEKGALQVEEITMSIPDSVIGLTEWNGKKLNSEISKTLRILPSQLMEGFYVAKLKKVTSTVPSYLKSKIIRD